MVNKVWAKKCTDDVSDRDFAARIWKAKAAFICLDPIWRSKLIGRKTEHDIFNTNFKQVPLNGFETWTIKTTLLKI